MYDDESISRHVECVLQKLLLLVTIDDMSVRYDWVGLPHDRQVICLFIISTTTSEVRLGPFLYDAAHMFKVSHENTEQIFLFRIPPLGPGV